MADQPGRVRLGQCLRLAIVLRAADVRRQPRQCGGGDPLRRRPRHGERGGHPGSRRHRLRSRGEPDRQRRGGLGEPGWGGDHRRQWPGHGTDWRPGGAELAGGAHRRRAGDVGPRRVPRLPFHLPGQFAHRARGERHRRRRALPAPRPAALAAGDDAGLHRPVHLGGAGHRCHPSGERKQPPNRQAGGDLLRAQRAGRPPLLLLRVAGAPRPVPPAGEQRGGAGIARRESAVRQRRHLLCARRERGSWGFVHITDVSPAVPPSLRQRAVRGHGRRVERLRRGVELGGGHHVQSRRGLVAERRRRCAGGALAPGDHVGLHQRLSAALQLPGGDLRHRARRRAGRSSGRHLQPGGGSSRLELLLVPVGQLPQALPEAFQLPYPPRPERFQHHVLPGRHVLRSAGERRSGRVVAVVQFPRPLPSALRPRGVGLEQRWAAGVRLGQQLGAGHQLEAPRSLSREGG